MAINRSFANRLRTGSRGRTFLSTDRREDVMTGYTVLDLETTGLFPQQHDRVIEIGIVSVSDEGEVLEEWSTLVNPGRDVGPTDLHGISARDVLDAPTFREVAPHVITLLSGRTLVAHNARFDTQFLDHEFSRAGLSTRPPTPSLCTMQLSTSYLRGASRKLKDCCAAANVSHGDVHTLRSVMRERWPGSWVSISPRAPAQCRGRGRTSPRVATGGRRSKDSARSRRRLERAPSGGRMSGLTASVPGCLATPNRGSRLTWTSSRERCLTGTCLRTRRRP
ncbi:3'-5' exonuclease [Nocardioides jishulii]|uniref:3'-5' exonuclease n=1 Tax=Nocardioides jishulii TaxID=2575440 RepID=A0A4U2YLJ2_9ACTN|nr:3'-5' exonuclease [Nocardioides jishulii]TKI61455.1 3'-5' exonuclease [Nocardioides jishulii]